MLNHLLENFPFSEKCELIVRQKFLLCDTSLIAVEKYQSPPYKITTKENVYMSTPLRFSKVTYEEIVKEVNNLDNKKSSAFSNIPFKRLKEALEFVTVTYLIFVTMKLFRLNCFPINSNSWIFTKSLKKMNHHCLKTIDLSVNCRHMFRRYLRGLFKTS